MIYIITRPLQDQLRGTSQQAQLMSPRLSQPANSQVLNMVDNASAEVSVSQKLESMSEEQRQTFDVITSAVLSDGKDPLRLFVSG